MTPESFHDLLDHATDAPPPPPPPGVEIAEGRRRLLRRRLGAVAAGAVTAVVVVGGALAMTTGSDPGHAQDPVAEAPRADDHASLLDSCRSGNQSHKATDAIFGPGTPVVKGAVQTDFEIVLALESADGAYWGECWIHLLSAEFGSGITVYPADPAVGLDGVSSLGTNYTSGSGCALVDGEVPAECRKWFVQWVDRLPTAVAAVRFELAGGTTTTVPSRDGYVVLNHLGVLPDDVSMDPEEGLPMIFLPIVQITYLDASGTPIAAERQDGTGLGEDRERVDGLPLLSAYPSLRGEAIY